MRRLLITGGLGYVGGRIAKYLSENSDYYILLGTRKSELKRPEWLTNGEIVNIDLLSENSLDEVCKGVDTVIHLAALNEIDSVLRPAQAVEVNCIGTIKLLEAAEKNKVERFIYFSTAHIYGSPLVGEIDEATLTRPVHPYAITHKTAEDFVLSYHDKGKIAGLVIRLSNSFGWPASADVNRWTLLVNDLCKQAVTTGKLVLKSAGLQKRDFIPLHDVCSAVEYFLALPTSSYGDAIFNLGGGRTSSIIEMTERIADRCEVILGFRPEIVRPEPGVGGPAEELHYSIAKLKSLGFQLSGDINKEIDGTLIVCKEAFGYEKET